jgi:hypothetical protein
MAQRQCEDGERKVIDGKLCVCIENYWVCGPVFEPDSTEPPESRADGSK